MLHTGNINTKLMKFNAIRELQHELLVLCVGIKVLQHSFPRVALTSYGFCFSCLNFNVLICTMVVTALYVFGHENCIQINDHM